MTTFERPDDPNALHPPVGSHGSNVHHQGPQQPKQDQTHHYQQPHNQPQMQQRHKQEQQNQGQPSPEGAGLKRRSLRQMLKRIISLQERREMFGSGQPPNLDTVPADSEPSDTGEGMFIICKLYLCFHISDTKAVY